MKHEEASKATTICISHDRKINLTIDAIHWPVLHFSEMIGG